MTCTDCPHERCGSCPCVCSPGEHDMPCAVRCESCGTSSPVELGPEEFCGVCKPMPAARDEAAIERATSRVGDILSPYSRELTPGILAEQIVDAVLEELRHA